MGFEKELDFKVGNGVFRKLWTSAPSSTTSSDGLGPLYNARSCESCHLKDGRGHVPVADEAPVPLFLRLSLHPPPDAPAPALASPRRVAIPQPADGSHLQP